MTKRFMVCVQATVYSEVMVEAGDAEEARQIVLHNPGYYSHFAGPGLEDLSVSVSGREIVDVYAWASDLSWNPLDKDGEGVVQ
jgi:hypothetical protein